VFGAPDSDTQVEQTEKSIAASLEISDDEQDMKEDEDDDQRLSLLSHRQGKASPRRARRAGR
jgi:CHASE3 domain sensor protein